MTPKPTLERLTADHLRIFADLRGPLRAWLLQSHGQSGFRDGLIGLIGAAVALVGLSAFDVSPLLVVLHLLVALSINGMAGRMHIQQASASPRPFVSPAHALAFADAVKEACSRTTADAFVRLDRLPGGRDVATIVHRRNAHEPRTWLSRALMWTVISGVAAFVALLFAVPLARASVALFDRFDWFGLATLATINAVQVWSATRVPASAADAPWVHAWFVELPAVRQLIFWHQCKGLTLFAAFCVCLLLIAAVGPTTGPGVPNFALAYEASIQPLAIALFVLSAALHLVLLAAPWHARRLLQAIDAVDVDRCV